MNFLIRWSANGFAADFGILFGVNSNDPMPASSSHKFTPAEIKALRDSPPWIMGVDEVAVVLGRSERSVRDDIRRGRIPHLRIGGAIKVRRGDLEKALSGLVRNPA